MHTMLFVIVLHPMNLIECLTFLGIKVSIARNYAARQDKSATTQVSARIMSGLNTKQKLTSHNNPTINFWARGPNQLDD